MTDGGTIITSRIPEFVPGSTAWRVSRKADKTRLRVARGGAVVGNLVWAALPEPLKSGEVYELQITWAPRSTAKSINLHIRNPDTGKFRVIGKAAVANGSTTPRTDTVVFKVTEAGFSQFMLGASQFTGWAAGADVSEIRLEQLAAEDERTKTASAPRSAGGKFGAVSKALALKDHERQVLSHSHAHSEDGDSGARARMIFHAHAIEKGLSRSNFRAGFGKISVPGLAKEMNAWLVDGRSTDDSFFQTSVAVMKSYFDRNDALRADVSHYRQLFSDRALGFIDGCDHREGGVLPASETREVTSEPDNDRSFLNVMYGRRSVREFVNTPVQDDDIARAVLIAMQAPSVCNRQGPRVHQFDDPRVIKSVLAIQGGFSGYRMPPRLLLVTADLDAFLFAAERNQPFIDGGLFMMSLLLGLTHVGLGSCSLNTAMGTEKEQAIRKLIDIPEHEVFISFIAVGHYDSEVLVPRSKRTELSQVLTRHPKN